MKNFQSLESVIFEILDDNNAPLKESKTISMFNEYRTELEKYNTIFAEAKEPQSDDERKTYKRVKDFIGSEILKDLYEEYSKRGELKDIAFNKIYDKIIKDYFKYFYSYF